MDASLWRRAEFAFLLAVAAFLVGFCLLGEFYYGYSFALMRFPLLAAGVTLVVVVVQLVALARGEAPGAAPDRPTPDPQAADPSPADPSSVAPAGGEGPAWPTLLWLFSIVPLVFLLGFPLGLALYLLGFLKAAGEGWGLSLGLAGASLLLSYGLFIQILGVPLPLLPFWWPA